ncbi:hypothetical protein BYT27DRAFT_7314651 [Phlegmacium glaucopus]|nr:hypothetical protein BYT27DRAFT_7314651 [Phlegmacium glaucopus]
MIDCEFKTNYNTVVNSVHSKLPPVKYVMREVFYQDVRVPIWFLRGSCWPFGLKGIFAGAGADFGYGGCIVVFESYHV